MRRYISGHAQTRLNPKPIHKATTEEAALAALDNLEAKWASKYGLGVKSWRNNWPEISTIFKYPPETRTLIYTINAIENFNRQLRKMTKTSSVFISNFCIFRCFRHTLDKTGHSMLP